METAEVVHATHTRNDDPPMMKVNREIPLWSLVTGLILLIVQAVGMIATQLEQGKLLAKMEIQVSALTVELTKANMKNVEYDFRLSDIDRRLLRVEANTAATNAANVQANTAARIRR